MAAYMTYNNVHVKCKNSSNFCAIKTQNSQNWIRQIQLLLVQSFPNYTQMCMMTNAN